MLLDILCTDIIKCRTLIKRKIFSIAIFFPLGKCMKASSSGGARTYLVSEPTTVQPRRRRTARISAVTTRSRVRLWRAFIDVRTVALSSVSAIGNIVPCFVARAERRCWHWCVDVAVLNYVTLSLLILEKSTLW